MALNQGPSVCPITLPIGCCQRTTARKTPAISTRKCPCQKLANPCLTLGQLLASRILYALLVRKKQHEIARARFCTQSCSKVGQLLGNSSPTPHPMGSCRGHPCSSPLATPDPTVLEDALRLSRLVSGMASNQDPSVFPIALPTVLGDNPERRLQRQSSGSLLRASQGDLNH